MMGMMCDDVETDQGPHVTGPLLTNNVKIDRHTLTLGTHTSSQLIYLFGWNFLVKLRDSLRSSLVAKILHSWFISL